MKFKNLIPKRFRYHVVRQFGQGQLIRLPSGQHEFIGGTDADYLAAIQWASLFAHNLVFKMNDAAPRRTQPVGQPALPPPRLGVFA